eukprot:4443444-Pyramimonas_sp.AAC.1
MPIPASLDDAEDEKKSQDEEIKKIDDSTEAEVAMAKNDQDVPKCEEGQKSQGATEAEVAMAGEKDQDVPKCQLSQKSPGATEADDEAMVGITSQEIKMG